MNTDLLIDNETGKDERNRVIQLSLKFLREGKSIILFSTVGPDDPFIQKTKDKMKSLGIDVNEVGKHLGKQQGLILRELVEISRTEKGVRCRRRHLQLCFTANGYTFAGAVDADYSRGSSMSCVLR